ncbi:MAG: serine/threonine protein kinase [Chloroflexi bacterium]|nr:serine/threonine protein kinase [Chloroflexota bacterium]
MSNWNGKTIGNVQIGEFIARGGMAEVYLGEHKSLNRKVAVKIMRDHVDHDPDTRMRFEREARVVASLRHPNIIQMLDYDLVDGQPCLIMEYVPGATLANYLKTLHSRKEKLPQEMIVKIVSALASAIDYAHANQIVHRDVKPANVLLRSASMPIDLDQPLPADVEPILTDFGLVRLLDSSTQTATGTVTGTPAYMSPEQARGDKVGRKTDLYSLGVILYEMLAGEVPFEAESSFGVLMKHLNDPPPPIPGIPSDMQTIIDRTLAKDAELRYASAGEMADEFIAVLNGQTVSPKTVAVMKTARAVSQAAKNPRSFSWRWAAFGALIMVGLAFTLPRFLTAPALDENQPVGRVVYSDQNGLMDKATITLTGLSAPKAGTHFDVWALAEGGENRLNIGSVTFNESAQGQLVYTNPKQENILSLFDQLEVTLEADDDPQSSGDVVASSVFPPLALIHVRHVLVSFPTAPQESALIQGLWNSSDWLYSNVGDLQVAFSNGDEELFRAMAEEIINLIAGNANANQYADWNQDSKISDPTDGYGLLLNGEAGYNEQGYIPQVISHAQFAAQAVDSTENIKTQSASVVLCLENMQGWSEQLLAKILELQAMPFGSDMEPLIADVITLSDKIISGVDANGNNLIEPIAGEGGATTAYEYAYYMADMPLLSGAHRIPNPAPALSK